MFVALGVLLSTLFTPILPSVSGNAQPSTRFDFYNYQVESIGSAPHDYYDVDNQEYQYFRYYNPNLDVYLCNYANNTIGTYDLDLFTLSYTDTNDLIFQRYFVLGVNYEVFSISPSPGYTVYRTRNYSFYISINDYDYSEVPQFNYFINYYWSNNEDCYYTPSHQYGFDRDSVYLINRELDDYSYASDYNVDYIVPFYFYINFKWIPSEIYYLSLEGYAPDTATSFNNGYQSGFNDGVKQGENTGYAVGYSDGKSEGEQIGYSNGYAEALDQGATASIIFNGIISVGLLPVNVFLRMLNFEVFGINIGAFVSSLLTICVIIIIMRMFLGGKSGSE